MNEKLNDKSELKKKNDIISKQAWHCDTYCRKICHINCEGKKNFQDNAPDLCPYFDEMLY